MTDPAALLTRLHEAKQSRDVWQIGLAEQALEHAAPELAAEVVRLRAENEKLRAAICWIEPPFIDAKTPESELRKRIDFCVQDAKRAALKGGEI